MTEELGKIVEAAEERLNSTEKVFSPEVEANHALMNEIFGFKQFNPEDSALFSKLYNYVCAGINNLAQPELMPNCAAKTLAYRKIREALFYFEQAILQKKCYQQEQKSEG